MINERKSYANPEQLLRERKQLFIDTVRLGRKPTRIPILANTITWTVVDSPYKLSEAIYDEEKMFDVVCSHHEKYEFDLYTYTGARNWLEFSDAFGKDTCYIIDDENYGINYPDSASIAAESDYPALLEKGLIRYYFENGIPGKYGLTNRDDIIERFGKAITAYFNREQYLKRVKKQFNEKYGVPSWSPIVTEFPLDIIYKAIRGMKGFSIDLRRNQYFIEKTLEMLDEHFYPKLLKRLDNFEDRDDFVFAMRTTSLVHTVLSPKQFEKYLWPHIKRFAEDLAKRNMVGSLFMEGNIDPFVDFFQDIPPGHLVLQIENGDPIALKRKLHSNVTLAGGYNSYYLGRGSEKETVETATALLDAVAYDGRYIFTTDKMLSFVGDAKAENFLALNRLIKDYKLP